MLLCLSLLLILAGCRGVRPPRNAVTRERVLITTGYCHCGKCCGWKRTWYGRPVYSYGGLKGQRKRVGITASGTRARKGTLAGDARYFPFGVIMEIPGYGYGRVEDRGGQIKGNHIDLYFPTHAQAEEWGKQTKKVKIWYPDPAS